MVEEKNTKPDSHKIATFFFHSGTVEVHLLDECDIIVAKENNCSVEVEEKTSKSVDE